RQEQPKDPVKAVLRIKVLCQGSATGEDRGILLATVLGNPIFDQPPRLAHAAAIQKQGMFRPQVFSHLRPAKLHLATWTAQADAVLELRTPFRDERAGTGVLFQLV